MLVKLMLSAVILFSVLNAHSVSSLYGEWQTTRSSINKGVENIENEFIRFRPATVQIILKVSVKRGNYNIKNLEVIADGIWKLYKNEIIIVLQQVRVPQVESMNGFTQSDINKLAKKLRSKYMDDPIKIYEITSLGDKSFVVISEDGVMHTFRRD